MCARLGAPDAGEGGGARLSGSLCTLVPQESASGAPRGARSRSFDMTELGTFGRVEGVRRVARGATGFRVCEPRG
eukprot:2331103-Prymnesium_polylepis.1